MMRNVTNIEAEGILMSCRHPSIINKLHCTVYSSQLMNKSCNMLLVKVILHSVTFLLCHQMWYSWYLPNLPSLSNIDTSLNIPSLCQCLITRADLAGVGHIFHRMSHHVDLCDVSHVAGVRSVCLGGIEHGSYYTAWRVLCQHGLALWMLPSPSGCCFHLSILVFERG